MIEGLYDFAKEWSREGSVWLYSDPHFGDEELAASIPERPTAEEQVGHINAKVGKKDTIVILGDVGDIDYVRKLRGRKVLVTGNHDKGTEMYKREIKKVCFDSEEYSEQEAIALAKLEYPNYIVRTARIQYSLLNPPFKKWVVRMDNCLFDEVYGGPLMISPKIILSHEPLDINWAFNIHGHNHALEYDRPGHKCVCSDVVLYKPISLAEIIKSGRVNEVTPLHRTTIDRATERKAARSKHE